MEIDIGIGKSGRQAYGFDDIAIVPSRRTRDPEDVSVSWTIDAFTFDMPVIAAPMDSVMSPESAIALGKLGGLGVLNLEGLWTRYEDPTAAYDEIAAFSEHDVTAGASPRRGAQALWPTAPRPAARSFASRPSWINSHTRTRFGYIAVRDVRAPSHRACAWDRSHKCPSSAFPTCSEDTRMRQGFMIGVPSSARTPTAHPSMLTGDSFKILIISCTSGCFHPSHQRGHSKDTLPPLSRTRRAMRTNVLTNT